MCHFQAFHHIASTLEHCKMDENSPECQSHTQHFGDLLQLQFSCHLVSWSASFSLSSKKWFLCWCSVELFATSHRKNIKRLGQFESKPSGSKCNTMADVWMSYKECQLSKAYILITGMLQRRTLSLIVFIWSIVLHQFKLFLVLAHVIISLH